VSNQVRRRGKHRDRKRLQEAARGRAAQRVVYGARCTWWGLITETATRRGLPCCPYCGGVLFEQPDEATWWAGVDRAEAEGRTGYRALIEWARGRCFPNFAELEAAYARELREAQ
jgi:hypothetical protein